MDRTIGKSQNRNYDGERLMKILKSYKRMMAEFINEADVDDEKMEKGLSKNGRVEFALQKANESVKVGGLNERAWTPAQEKAVKELNKKHQKLIAKKGIEPYSYEASQLWTSGGFKKEMRKIFGKDVKEGVNEADVDDEKIIKYKTKDGEPGEMKAGSAKTMPKDHPAKISYDKMQDDGGDSEKDSGGKLGGGDFDRDSGDSDKSDDNSESDDVEISDANSGPIDTDDITDMLKNDSEVVDKMGDDVYWDGMDLVSSKYDDDTIASIPDDASMTLADLKKQIMDYEGDDDNAADDEADDMDRDARFAADDEESESELDALDKKIKDTEANMNMAASNYGDPQQQELAGELFQDLEKLKAKREKLAGGSDKNETKVINGVKYKPIKESKKHPLKENYDRIFRSRK